MLSRMQEQGFSASILTKSDYIVRDLDVLKQMPDASVGVSVAFQDESVREIFEKSTIPLIERVREFVRVRW